LVIGLVGLSKIEPQLVRRVPVSAAIPAPGRAGLNEVGEGHTHLHWDLAEVWRVRSTGCAGVTVKASSSARSGHGHEPLELAAAAMPLDCINDLDAHCWGMDVRREVGFEPSCERRCVEPTVDDHEDPGAALRLDHLVLRDG